ncbi:MAG: M28 family peptidase [Saprospiraceae bacterium]
MKKLSTLIFLLGTMSIAKTQTNFSFSNPEFEQILKGNFDPNNFEKRLVKADADLAKAIQQEIHPDSLSKYLHKIVSFQNRNTVNDTATEPDKGIRGARNYVRSLLDYWNAQKDRVIISTDFEFDFVMCNRIRHTELMSIIPGNGNQKNEMVIVEAHIDSRCEDRCNISCLAEGAEDNGSGSTLITELARIFSKIELNRTLVIIWITGEEQGLGGSKSFAAYCKTNGIKIKAVFNNDIVGGIECGKTSSVPSCPGPYQYDSTHLRIFSLGTTNSMHKNLARMTKLLVDQHLNFASPTKIDVMVAEDRTGRGSDQIPFRENGFTSIRFTSSYEHGDGNPDQVGYEDRQHSSRDVLGKDLDGDGILDSLYVNFNYLANNCFVNALAISNAASNTLTPPVLQSSVDGNKILVDITNLDAKSLGCFICLRKFTSVYYDTIIFSKNNHLEIGGLASSQYYLSACTMDSAYWLSMIGQETLLRVVNHTSDLNVKDQSVEMFQNKPNPFDEYTIIPIQIRDLSKVKKAELIIHDANAKELQKINLHLENGMNEILFELPKNNISGDYFYSLRINGEIQKTLKMEILNY